MVNRSGCPPFEPRYITNRIRVASGDQVGSFAKYQLPWC
jgi:hypothetical protein